MVVAGLLASIVAVAPTPAAPVVRAAGTVYVGATGSDGGAGGCGAPQFGPGSYTNGSEGAIEAAIADAGAGGTVVLCNGTHLLTSGDVTVGITDVTFQGESTANTIVDGGGAVRLFDADGRDVSFRGLTLSNGWVNGPGGAVIAQSVTVVGAKFIGNMTAPSGNGAAIFAYGTVDSRWSVYQDNTSGDNGGAMYVGGTVTSLHDTFDGNTAACGGGAVYGADTATLDFAHATGNTSGCWGGAIYGDQGVDSSSGIYEDNVVTGDPGGAIFAYSGVITSRDDAFRRNYAEKGGGAIYSKEGTIDSSSGIYEDNTSGTDDSGGAIHAELGSVTSSHDEFYRNSGYSGGAIWANDDVDSTSGIYQDNTAFTGYGGAIYTHTGSVTSDHDVFHGNVAQADGGAIFVRLAWLESSFSLYEDNTSVGYGGAVSVDSYYSPSRFTSRFDTFSGNSSEYGGAVYAGRDCDSSAGTYEGNHARDDGGAIACYDDSLPLRSLNDVFRDNHAGTGGGALSMYGGDFTGGTFEDNSAGSGTGGAIWAVGTLRIDRSTFARNRAERFGGAVDQDDSLYDVYVTNSTFAANEVTNGGKGGAIRNRGDVHTTYSTFVDNSADTTGEALAVEGDAYFDHALIVGSGSAAVDCAVGGSRHADYSIETGSTCLVGADSSTGIARADLHLGTFAAHGSTTWTWSLQPDSLAVDFDTTVATCAGGLTTDQRGVARPTGAGCDTGSYEYEAVTGPGAYIDDGSGTCADYATIQEAVDAASNDDTIVVCDGVHELDASVAVSKNGLTFIGESTAGTIVDGGDALRLFDATGKDVTFVGLTLTNGKATTNGGGAVRGTNVTLVGVDATSNTADGNVSPSGFGGAVFASASVSVLGGTYADNVGGGNGGAIASNGSVSITSGEFIGNRALARGGGAVFSAVDATIVDGTFIDNTSNTYGGAIDANGVTLVAGLFQRNVTGFNAGFEPTWGGGAVFSYAYPLSVTGTVFDANRSQGKPGGAIGTTALVTAVTIAGASFTDNSSATKGGAIYADSDVDITASTFIANTSGDRGGAVYATGSILTNGSDYSANTSGVSGGAVYATGSVVTNGSDYSANTATGNGGAIRAVGSIRSVGGSFVANTALNGGALSSPTRVSTIGTDFIANEASDKGGAIDGTTLGPVRVDVTGGTFAENTAGSFAGAILASGAVTVDGSLFRDNSADTGGAIRSYGAVDLSAATFLRNTSLDDGGAVYVAGTSSLAARQTTFSGNSAGAEGGAIYLGGVASGGPISIDASTFNANSADSGGAVYGGSTVASVRNSTFYENTANTGDGGAFWVDTVDVTNGTFAGNSASASGDHVKAATSIGSVDSIFAGGDCAGPIGTNTGNRTTDAATCPDGAFGSVTTGALNLQPLAGNGGPTKTVKVLSPSAAIDVYAATTCPTATDQRGSPRPVAGGCDAGAYEAGPNVVLTYTGPSFVFISSGSSANVTLSGSVYPALAGCDLRFDVSGGTGPATTYYATSGTKGTGSVTAYGLPSGTYEVIVKAVGDCAGIPDGSGAFVITLASFGKGTAGGGSYSVTNVTGRVRFAHTVQVVTVSSKLGKSLVTTTTTKGSLLWTYKNAWRVKANINYSSTDASATYGIVSCTSGDFSTGGAAVPTGGTCGRFSGAALLQVYDPVLGWVASTYTKVTFVATVYDGGTKSVCSKNKCTTTDYPDWFGLRVWANNVPLGLSTSPTPVPTSLMRSLQSPDGNGSLKAN